MIPLHLPHITGKEKEYINQVIDSGKLSGNGAFTKKCHSIFEEKFGFSKVLLTNSCTDALEMCALLLDLKVGDEILLPSFTFVSTANAFHNFGAKLVFCDSGENDPNLNIELLEAKITAKTKAIVVMHYAGIACEMNSIMKMAEKHGLMVIEDAALGLGSKYENKPLGSFGDLSTFSFHQTKNITCGEGGLLVINNPELREKAEIIWEKGTNRSAFLRGESDKYEWVSKGSSFLTSELHAAFLLAQLEKFDEIQKNLIEKWNKYYENIRPSKGVQIPVRTENHQINGSIFYLIFEDAELLNEFMEFMQKHNVSVSTHYRCLHKSKFYKDHFDLENLINCDRIAKSLIRLPLYMDLKKVDQNLIIEKTNEFIKNNL